MADPQGQGATSEAGDNQPSSVAGIKMEDITVGMRVEAKDCYDKWFCAKVVEKDDEEEEVVVHFDGWSSRYDEIIHIRDGRLRLLSAEQLAEKKKVRKPKPLEVGDRVQAKWQDGRMYLGRILQLLNQMAVVLFDDGIEYTAPISAVRRRRTDSSHSGAESTRVPVPRRERKRQSRDNSTAQPSVSPPSSPLFAPKRTRVAIQSNQFWETDESTCTESDIDEGSCKRQRSDSSPTCISSDSDLRPPLGKRGKQLSAEGLREPYKLRRHPAVTQPQYSPTKKKNNRSLKPKSKGSSGDEVVLSESGAGVRVEGGGEEGESRDVREKAVHRKSTRTSDEAEDIKTIDTKTAVILSPKEDKDRVPAMSENPLLTVETPSLLLDLLPSRSHDSDDSRLFCEEQLPLPVHQRRKLDFLDRRPAKPGQHFWEALDHMMPMESQQSTNFSQRRCGGVIKGPECSDISEVPPTPACLSPCPSAPFAAPPLTPSAPSHSSEPSARVHPRGDKVTTSKSQLRSHSQAITSCWRRSSSQSTNVNTRFRAQTAFENSKKGKERGRQGKVAPKELVILWDHNEFKCQHAGCAKSFRKQSLLQSHMKHYHNVLQMPPMRRGRLPTGAAKPLQADKTSAKSPHTPSSSSSLPPAHTKPSKTPSPKSLSSSLESDLSHPVTPSSPSPDKSSKSHSQDRSLEHASTQDHEKKEKLLPSNAALRASTASSNKSPKKGTRQKSGPQNPSPASCSDSTGAVSVGTPAVPTQGKTPSALSSQYSLVPQSSKYKPSSSSTKKLKSREGVSGSKKGELSSRRPVSPSLPSSSAASFPLVRGGMGGTLLDDVIEGRGQGGGETGWESVSGEVKSVQSASLSFVKDEVEKEHITCMSRSTSPSSEVNDDDVVHCVCGDETDEGFMIQCEQCLCWQHGDCIGMSKNTLPEKYLCCFCTNPPGLRRNKKYLYDLQWYCDGTLPSLPGGPKFPCPEAMLKCHALLDRLHQLRNISHSSKVKLQAARNPSHAYLRQWSKECARLDKETFKSYLAAILEPVSIQNLVKAESDEEIEEGKEKTTRCSGDVTDSVSTRLDEETEGLSQESITMDNEAASQSKRGNLTNGDNVTEGPGQTSAGVMPLSSVKMSVLSPAVITSPSVTPISTETPKDRGMFTSSSLQRTTEAIVVPSKEDRLLAGDSNVLDPEKTELEFTSEFGVQELSVFALKEGKNLPQKQLKTIPPTLSSETPTIGRSSQALPPIPSVPLLVPKRPLQASSRSAFKPVVVAAKPSVVTSPTAPTPYRSITPTCTSSQLTSLLTSPISTHPQSLVSPVLASPSTLPPLPLQSPPPSSTVATIKQGLTTTPSGSNPVSLTESASNYKQSAADGNGMEGSKPRETQIGRLNLTPNIKVDSIYADTATSLPPVQISPPPTPVLVKDFTEAFYHGDTTNWFKRMLLLDHIENVQDDMLSCVEQMEKELDELSDDTDVDGLDYATPRTLLNGIQSTLEQLTSFQRQVISSRTH